MDDQLTDLGPLNTFFDYFDSFKVPYEIEPFSTCAKVALRFGDYLEPRTCVVEPTIQGAEIRAWLARIPDDLKREVKDGLAVISEHIDWVNDNELTWVARFPWTGARTWADIDHIFNLIDCELFIIESYIEAVQRGDPLPLVAYTGSIGTCWGRSS